ncbi:hypothetical protein GCM10011588_72620 [Nocardia jinanensis]|uniref:Uncharacterized protein n=1 Tax=Nocardia jinanensis TaxID=382504 RepID=A0A917S0W0_9NOCA|nr:hypothetical protein GCM10011588_72620 [Nocardia jinanensis]
MRLTRRVGSEGRGAVIAVHGAPARVWEPSQDEIGQAYIYLMVADPVMRFQPRQRATVGGAEVRT